MDITCVLIDDERRSLDHVLTYTNRVPFLRVVGTFTDPAKALSFLEENSVDVVFMDIEMPNHPLGGMDLVAILGDRQRYVFTTAYPEHALKSYDYNAVDFLHKPYSFERFLKAVQKVKLVLTGLQADLPEAPDTHCYIRHDGKLQRVEYEAICYIKSERSYLSIYTDQDRITTQMAIGELEKKLPQSLFMRVHKSFIVARKRLEQIETDQVGIARDKKLVPIPIGEVYRKAIFEKVMPVILQKK